VIRVLLADDERLMRAGVRMILESAEDIEVVAEADDGPAAVHACTQQLIDVALLDIRMPGGDGLAAAGRIAQVAPRTKVVMLTTFGEERYVAQAMRAGAIGFVLKDTDPLELIRAVHLAAAGDPVLAPQVTRDLIDRHLRGSARPEAAAKVASLTTAETDVLRLVGAGLSNAEVGARLHVSEGTVKAHIGRVLTKLECANRVQAAIVAHEAGLLD
ncbi:response regulator transcription factor, partial [Crossiella equi]|uniref:response regulator transcription factor n=1 Tax=Crossiella equi TaxID=130796 RepID=UPI0030B7F597